uniref:CCHC-type domain-containing protein n=1 Tax=Tanacetum cinerariifolium TaxID=118510 RepID=A0A6L2J715_TANCI|nr:hypothetical protein [Tanacetum cinerariifolium]
MESLSPQVVVAAKLPILNPNEFDMWKMRIEQYFLMTDYSLWEVILNGDSPTPTRIVDDAKSLMEAIEKRFGGNKETKKVQKTLLKQQYENFSGTSSESLDQIHDRLQNLISQLEILEEMYLKWQMDMLTMRARMFLQKTRRNLGTNGTVAIGFDMSKVECYNCLRIGHFARDCRSPRDNKNKDTPRRTVPVEVSTLNALVSQCSSSSSRIENEVAPCSKACSKAYATLQSHYDNLTVDFKKSQIDVLSYKTGLESVKARDNALVELRKKFEKAEKERDALKLTLEKFQTSSKNLNASVPTSPVHDRYKSGEGYHAVPPPYTRTFMPPKPDLVFNDALKASETVTNVTSDSEDESEIECMPTQKEPSFVQTSEPVKTPRASVKIVEHPKQAENLRPDNQKSRGHKNSWNRKACFVCKSLNHSIKDCDYYKKQMVQNPVWNNVMRVNHHNSTRMSHSYSNRNVILTVVLTRSGLVSLNTSRPVSTAVPHTTVKRSPRPVIHVVYKAHLLIRRPINQKPATKTSNFNQKVTAVQVNKVTAVKGNKGSWVWKPKCTMLYHVSRLISASMNLKKFDYTDALGRSNKELPSPKQTALGKDNSNLLIVDSLLKTIWLLMHHVISLKHWLFQEKQQLEEVVITEDVIRQDLRLDDADVPKELDWNEFICSMASAVVCLATCRKFNFSKYIFDSMVRNVDRPSKFLMVGKGFSRVETPLFATMLVQPQPLIVEEEHEVQIIKLKKRVKKLEKTRRSKFSGGCIQTGGIEAIDADKEITLVEMKTKANLGAELQGRKDDDNAAIKDASAAEPNMFDDKEMQEKHLDNIRKYQSLKRKPISIAQARKNMIVYLKNMAGFKKLKAVEVSGSHSTQDTPTDDPKEMSKEDVKNMLEIILVSEFKVEALQKLHSNCGVHQVSSTTRRHDMYMLTEKDYPLSNEVITLMLSTRLQVEEDSKMARDLVMKIFMKANQPKNRSLDTSSKQHVIKKLGIQLHSGHGHLDVSHVVDEFGKLDIVVKGQNRLEVVLDQDAGHLHSLQKVFPEMSPSDMVLHQ